MRGHLGRKPITGTRSGHTDGRARASAAESEAYWARAPHRRVRGDAAGAFRFAPSLVINETDNGYNLDIETYFSPVHMG